MDQAAAIQNVLKAAHFALCFSQIRIRLVQWELPIFRKFRRPPCYRQRLPP